MVLQMPRPFKKPETGVYYLRRIVPEDIRAIIGKTEVRRSLKTKDPRTAARRFTEAAREVDKEWEELRREPESTKGALRQALASLNPQDLIEDAMGMEGILDERDAPEDWEPTPKALRTAIRARSPRPRLRPPSIGCRGWLRTPEPVPGSLPNCGGRTWRR
jgi:hypothetical protein